MSFKRSAHSASRRRPATLDCIAPVIESLEKRLCLSTDVLTYRDSTAGTGVDDTEVQLTPANVKTGSFGKLFTTPVDGNVYAEPLVDTGVTIASGVNTTAGAAGVHDVVFVATENDTLYAINADANGGNILWQRSFLNTSNAGGDQNNTLGATSISTVSSTDVETVDISPSIGITGTPVIDPTTNLLYVVVATKEVIGGSTYFVQRLHAINLADGTDAITPYLIGQTTNGNTNNTAIYVYGTGDGAVTDPYNGTGKQVVQFNALRESQRAAISLVNNTLYVSWASHGDFGPYHGWVVTWNVGNIKSSGFQLSGVLNTCPNDGMSGVWMGGGALAFEPDGSAFYFMTGNGTGGPPTTGPNGLPTDANYNEALVQAVADPTTSPTNQGPNGWGLKVVDYFIPYNVNALDQADSDFGSGAPILLPASAGIPDFPDMMVAGGKDGRVFLVDRDDMGGYLPEDDNVINAVPNSSGNLTAPNLDAGTASTPAYFNGKLYLISAYSGTAYACTINANGTLSVASQTAITSFGYMPGSPVISANGSTDGIVWLMDRQSNELHAYDANSLATELWNSDEAAGGADNIGTVEKMAVPTVANGEVYVGTTDALVVYGLLQPATKVPSAPVLTATALSGSSINLTWTDSSVQPNTASGYLVEQSTNDVNFTQVATVPAGASSVAIGDLNPLTKYYFRIRGFNAVGDSSYSNVASATTTNQAALIDFFSGFSSASGQLAINGSAALSGSDLELTNGGLDEASSAFFATPVHVTQFNTQFTFQLSSGANTADGFTFTLQNAGTTALGPLGGGLGYGPDSTGGSGGIASSVAIKFDLYSNQGEGTDSTGLFTDGAAPTDVGSINLSSTGINLHSGDVFLVNMSYNGTTLAVTITDTQTGASATQNYTVNIPNIVGKSTAYVGFTGGTGGLTAVQNILTWTYAPAASVSPNPPSGLGAAPASATSINLNWTNNATNQTGYHLDRATDPGFTQNLITQTLPANPSSFTDTAAGLAPGETYYYRLRAFNSAGDSSNSNVVNVSIPLAPPTPTDLVITNLTTTEIDLSWQDNAGHLADGYDILRSANGGSYALVATLPPTSRTAPSNYAWSDTSLTPGSNYSYEVEAYNVAGNNGFASISASTITSPPGNLTATGTGSAIHLSWTAPTGAATYNVYRGTSAGGEAATPIATGITSTSYNDTTAASGVKYFYEVKAVNANAVSAPTLPNLSAPSNEASSTTTAPSNPPEAITANTDIGGPALHGSSAFAAGVYTIKGAGSDIWNTSDQFQYDYGNVTGDQTVIARVTSVANTNAWAKAGVMIRSSTAANAMFADVVYSPGGFLAFQFRTATGQSAANYGVGGLTGPQWVKLTRVGNVFTGYYSSDGIHWVEIGSSVTIAMSSATLAGLAVCSHNPSALTTATFDNFSLTSP